MLNLRHKLWIRVWVQMDGYPVLIYAAHMVNMEKPDEFNRVVLGFLKRP